MPGLAHIGADALGSSPWWLLVAAIALAVLVTEHHLVAGFDRAELRTRGRRLVGVTAVVALSAAFLPTGGAQGAGALLPDLISDPPRPSFFNELNLPDGSTRLVVTFDGYVHNIGEGPLDVVGNPQEPGGMRQRVRNGQEWEEVGTPTVRYETDDGHNHFHLIEAIEYVLWNEAQGAQSAIGSKIGFCLVDSEQMEGGNDQSYSEELDNFCEEDNPAATSLRMGITPGWRDIYDATTTLQWVDVTNTTPGRYWIGAITDPNDEIVESNEANNDLIFSERTISVPGYAPRAQQPIVVDGPEATLSLLATAHGTVGTPLFTIIEGPSSGMLDVPLNASLGSGDVRYFPNAGFVGSDQITYSVHDASSPYPQERPTYTVAIEVSAGAAAAAAAGQQPPSLVAPSTFFETTVGEFSEVAVDAEDAGGEPARLYATGLPAGLSADPATRTISGVAAAEGIFNVTLIAVGAGPDAVSTLDVTWIVNPSESQGLVDLPARSSPRGELSRIRVGQNVLGHVFAAEGLPPGVAIEAGTALISGTPSQIGDFDVTIRELDADGQELDSTTFVWTIRRTTAIDFVL